MDDQMRNTGLGPHGQRMHLLSRRVTSHEMMERLRQKQDNTLGQLIEKFKRQALQNDSQIYPEELIGRRLESIDKLLPLGGKLAGILSSLEAENNALRNQLSIISSELSKSLGICEQLILENKQQKEIIVGKNNDLKRLVESIALNEAEARGELEHKNHLLQQENSILIRHLEQAKKEREQNNEELFKLEDQVNYVRAELSKVQAHHQEALEREQEVSRKLALLEQNYFSQGSNLSALRDQHEQLRIENTDMKNEVELLREQLSLTKRQSLTNKYEEQLTSLIQDYEEMKVERQQLVRECEKRKLDCEELANRNRDLEQEFNKLSTNHELVSSLLMQQKTRNAQLTANCNKLDSRVAELKHQNDSLRFEAERTTTVFSQKERILQGEIDQLRNQIDERAAIVEKRIMEIKHRADEALEAKDLQIANLTEANSSLKHIIGGKLHT